MISASNSMPLQALLCHVKHPGATFGSNAGSVIPILCSSFRRVLRILTYCSIACYQANEQGPSMCSLLVNLRAKLLLAF